MMRIGYHLKYTSERGHTVDFHPESGFNIYDSTGFTATPINIISSQAFDLVGTNADAHTVESKDVVINGEIIGYTKMLRKQLLDAFTAGVKGTLSYNDEWHLTVYPIMTPIIDQQVYNGKFQLMLRAPYPYWVSAEDNFTAMSGLFARFKFPWNFANTHRFGERVRKGAVNVMNTGNVPSRFSIIFRAVFPVVNPKVINLETEEFIQINFSMQQGDTIIVNATVSPPTVTLIRGTERTDIFGSLDIDSTLFPLQHGDNILADRASSGEESLETTILSQIAYTGAW